MNKNKFRVVYFIAGSIFIFFLIKELYFYTSERKDVTGWVTKVSTGGTSQVRIDYEFKVGENIYSGHDNELMNHYDCNCKENDSLIVEYKVDNPTINKIKKLSCHYD